MSALSIAMARVVADLQAKYGCRTGAQLAEQSRQRRQGRPVTSSAMPREGGSSIDVDHETARGIRSAWD